MSAGDVFAGIAFGIWYSREHLLNSYVIIPIGVILLFTILYGFNQLLTSVIKLNFPASVLGMLVNLVILSVLNVVSELPNKRKSERVEHIKNVAAYSLTNYLRLVKPAMNFSLKWINVFFIPSFIVLPLSDPITFIECLKIAGVFLVGFFLLLIVDVYLIMFFKWALRQIGYAPFDESADKKDDPILEDQSVVDEEEEEEDSVELQDFNSIRGGVFTSMRDDITTIDLSRLRLTKSEPAEVVLSRNENPFRTESNISIQQAEPVHVRGSSSMYTAPAYTPSTIITELPTSVSSSSNDTSPTNDENLQFNNLNNDSKKVAVFITRYIDWILYFTLFVVSLPFYYIRTFHTFLPYHLGITILAYFIALLIPANWPKLKKIAHPILILTAEILFVCFIGSLIYHGGKPKGFIDDLKYYKTGKTYLNLFSQQALYDKGKQNTHPITSTPQFPGCGDILSSLMDISIVSLSLPMFTHRKDFIRNFWVLVPPLLVSIALTFLCYPVFCYHIGIQNERAIGFIGRSVTLALGTPLIGSLGGSVSLMAVCTILSGIGGVLIGDTVFNLLRIPADDYVTRGVSLGINCGAIATAHLLNENPRAASMSSLSFSIFGTIMIILAAIGPIRDFIRSEVGL